MSSIFEAALRRTEETDVSTCPCGNEIPPNSFSPYFCRPKCQDSFASRQALTPPEGDLGYEELDLIRNPPWRLRHRGGRHLIGRVYRRRGWNYWHLTLHYRSGGTYTVRRDLAVGDEPKAPALWRDMEAELVEFHGAYI